MDKPLLFEFFSEMMQDRQWINPGMDNYYLLNALMSSDDFNAAGFEELAFALETIWLKSHHLKSRFRQMLEKRRLAIVEAMEGWADEQQRIANGETDQSTAAQAGTLEQRSEAGQEGAHRTTTGDAQQNREQKDAQRTGTHQETDATNGHQALETVFTLGSIGKVVSDTMLLPMNGENKQSLVNRPYVFTNDYFPIKSRHLQQAWRTLKNKQEAGFDSTISISQTITRTASKGYFSGFVYEKKTVNQLHLFVFIDQSASMVAVEEFGKEICAAAVSSNMYTGLVPLYFNKVPVIDSKSGDYLLTNEDGAPHNTLGKLFAPYFKKDIVVLLYSDVGAFKNDLDEKRVQETKKFIHHLYQKTGYLAWLNPAPRNRWPGTNAEKLQEYVAMFETGNSKTGRSEFESAMAALKGKWMC